MNVYKLAFKATCPIDGTMIDYAWELRSGYTVMAEELRRIVDSFGTELHERMADALFDRFGGVQILKATHAGDVVIETTRPLIAHWQRPEPSQAGSCQASGEWATVEVNQGFPALMEALERAARKGYMPDAMTAEWEAFEYRLPFSDRAPAPPAGRTLTAAQAERICAALDSSDSGSASVAAFVRSLTASSTTAGERE